MVCKLDREHGLHADDPNVGAMHASPPHPAPELPIARVFRAPARTLSLFVSLSVRTFGVERATKLNRGAILAIFCARCASVEKCADLYLYPRRPSAWRTNASPTGFHHSCVLGEGDHRHKPGTWFTRRRSAGGRGDACVARTPDRPLAGCTRAWRAKPRNTVQICILSAPRLRAGKGPETRPARRLHDFPRWAYVPGEVCKFVSFFSPTTRAANTCITDWCAPLPCSGGGPQAQTGNMVYTPTFRSW